MIARPLVGSRKARSPRHREAWIAFEDGAGRKPGHSPPIAKAGDEDDPRVVSYQRGEIALVQRVRELEGRLQRWSMALVGVLALVALGVIRSVTYCIVGGSPALSGATLVAEAWSSTRPRKRAWTASLPPPASSGASPAARCVSA
jgi:hypothetical protein